jgi:hypothetical protein
MKTKIVALLLLACSAVAVPLDGAGGAGGAGGSPP